MWLSWFLDTNSTSYASKCRRIQLLFASIPGNKEDEKMPKEQAPVTRQVVRARKVNMSLYLCIKILLILC